VVLFCLKKRWAKTDGGKLLPSVAADQGIVPGIKVDKGTLLLANASVI